jgi:hypothetical protein
MGSLQGRRAEDTNSVAFRRLFFRPWMRRQVDFLVHSKGLGVEETKGGNVVHVALWFHSEVDAVKQRLGGDSATLRAAVY